MKKKSFKFISIIAIVLTLSFSVNMRKTSAEIVPTPDHIYQTMAYCQPWHLMLACTTVQYADYCSKGYCLVHY